MDPDPKESLPREILEELMEEGAEAFRSVLEKLFNLAMEMERSEFLGAGAVPEDKRAARSCQWLQGQDGGHAGRTPAAEDPPGEKPVVLPEVAGVRMPVGEGLEAGDC